MRKLLVLTFTAMLFGHLATTWADPPAGRGSGVGSTLQRAVESRAGLQQRANARAQGSANAGGGVGVGVGQNSANANGSVGVSAGIQTDTNGSANAQSGTGRLPREVVVRRLQLLRSQQSAVVRTANRTDVGIGSAGESPSDASTTSQKKPQPNNPPPRGKFGQGSNPNPNENPESSTRSGLLSLNGSARSEVVAHGQNRLALTNADKILAQRLARIDQMRDQALESGNDQLLDQADRLELDARTQYAERLAATADDSTTEAGASTQEQATGAVRGRINRTTATNVVGDATADLQNEAAATIGKARRTTDRTRRDTNPAEAAGNVRNASVSGQANSTNAARAATAKRSLNATGTSATNGAASAQSK
jgi:hypothetical protein